MSEPDWADKLAEEQLPCDCRREPQTIHYVLCSTRYRAVFVQTLRQTRVRALEEALDLIGRTTTPRSDLYNFIQAEKK